MISLQLWYFGSTKGAGSEGFCSNLKANWVNNGRQCDWLNRTEAQGRTYLRRAIQVKNIWVPYRA